ncbi:MAG: hypothetical protein GY835_16395 [bacterium]|nr:hypothetical protein [bacterium]
MARPYATISLMGAGSVVVCMGGHATREKKYRVRGKTLEGADLEVIAKFSPTGKLVIITAYRL